VQNVETFYPLSPMQEGMLFGSLASGDPEIFVTQFGWALDERLDHTAFEQAWQYAAGRHAVLRTGFVWQDLERPVQVVHREVPVRVQYDDAAGSDRDVCIQRAAIAERKRGFELGKAPLMRVRVLRFSPESHYVVWTHHHLLLDGWSAPLLLREVFAAYDAIRNRETLELPPVKPFRDYIAWLYRQELGAAAAFWKRLGQDWPQQPIGIRKNARPPEASESVSHAKMILATATTTMLRDIARRQRITFSAMTQAIWAVLLSSITGQDDVAFGSVVSGRPATLPGVESMVGLFINALPVRVRIRPSESIIDLLTRVHQRLLDVREYEYSPLRRIQEWAGMHPGTQLFDTLFVFENYPVDTAFAQHARERRVTDVQSFERNNIPLNVFALPGDPVTFNFLYHTGVFQPRDVDTLARSYGDLLEQVASDPSIAVGRLRIAGGGEAVLLGSRLPAMATTFVPVHRRFEECARVQPDAIAIIDGDRTASYAELNQRANGLAGRLGRMQIGPEHRVAVVARRGIEALTAVLAILKTGAAYLPIDPEQPIRRIAAMLEQGSARLIVTLPEHVRDLPKTGVPFLVLDRDSFSTASGCSLPSACEPGSLAYVVFTSGSSGEPKGVMVEHRNIAASAQAWITDYALLPGERHLQMASFSFDVFAGDWVRALCSGGTLVICSKQTMLDAPRLLKLLKDSRVAVAEFVPAVLMRLLEHVEALGMKLPALRLLIAGSDVLRPDQLARLRNVADPRTRIANSYGLAETTVDSTWAEVGTDGGKTETVPIGHPFPGHCTYVLDHCLRPAPRGVAGQLYIGGDGVSRGYQERPNLTAERFLPDPFIGEPGATMYATGDRVRLNPSGEIEYLGRLDQQIKIRGIRIEPGDVEAALRTHARVREAAVVAVPGRDGDTGLAAYVVVDATADLSRELREHASSLLPPAAVPAWIIVCDRLPLTANGKINHRALPDPHEVAAPAFDSPETPTETALAALWSELLRARSIGRSSSFFELGGHSLIAARLITRVRGEFEVEMTLRDVFRHPTLHEFAEALDNATLEQADPELLSKAIAAASEAH